MKNAAIFLISATLSASAVSAQGSADLWRVETVAEDLNYPWDIESDGVRIFLTEKAGNVVTLQDGVPLRTPVVTSVPIETDGGRGLLGMALAPDFSLSNLAYFYHSVANGNRVIEARQTDGIWQETGVVLDGIPGHRLYNGGRIAFGPDGMLYITTGWVENSDYPQDPDSLAGKILRINRDGTVPPDNPWPGSPVWSLGHRNPQGIAWDGRGRLFAAEHGQSGHDEINLIEAGANYGWPLLQGDEVRDGMHAPASHSGRDTWAPSGMAMHEDRLLVAMLVGQGIGYLSDEVQPMQRLIDVGERLRDVQSLDGVLYAITTNRSPRGDGPSEDRLIRLIPENQGE